MRFGRLSGAFRSLRFRLTAWNTAVVLLTVVGAFIGVRQGLRHTLQGDMDAQLREDAEELARAVLQSYPDMEPVYQQIVVKAAVHRHLDLFVQLLDERDNVIQETKAVPLVHSVPRRSGELLATAEGYRIYRNRFGGGGVPYFTVRIGASLAGIDNDVAVVTHLMTIAGAAVLVLAPLGGFWLAGRATHPLEGIIHTAARLRPSHMDERLPIRGTGDQLDQLSITINHFLDQIADYLERNRAFVADAAHELRSPLAAIQSSAEVALNAPRSPQEYQELLCEIVDECSRLGVLVNQLLLLAEHDSEEKRTVYDPVRLDQIVATSLEMFRGVAEERSVELTADADCPIVVLGEAGGLRQVVNNLIDNGLKFTPPGGRLSISLRHDAAREEAVLVVSDTGMGISPEDLPHVFERFYRGDKSRQRESGVSGSGLGLSICQSIVASHGGTIRVESTPGRGTAFEVRIAAPLPSPGRALLAVGAAG
ncbi:MAG TPA: ATP-binding protein [Pirellulales bacterium]|nr:ATP-binding protein [Pirellulales bacterium]